MHYFIIYFKIEILFFFWDYFRWCIHSSISYFIKANLLGDNCFLDGNSPLLINLLMVETEIPSNLETSLMVKKGRSCEFMWRWCGVEDHPNHAIYYFRCIQVTPVWIKVNPARGVSTHFHKLSETYKSLFFCGYIRVLWI